MKFNKLNDITRKFLLNEASQQNPTLKSRLMALEELLNNIAGKSLAEVRRLEIIKEQVKEIKRNVRRLEEKNFILEQENKQLQEKLTLLEESKEE
jgi:regulator of replication initiation timing